MKITSLNNEFVKHLAKLKQKKYRDETQQVLLEGDHLYREILAAQYPHQTIGVDANCDIVITETIAKKISSTTSGSTFFTLITKQDVALAFDQSRYLLVDDVQDPGNLGTMIRTAYSFGFDGVILSTHSVDEFNEKCIRATQGALFHIPVIRMDLEAAIKRLKAACVSVYATYLHEDTIALESIKQETRLAIVMGNEGNGVSNAVLNASNGSIKIETSRFESLNVAIATAIVCYTLRK